MIAGAAAKREKKNLICERKKCYIEVRLQKEQRVLAFERKSSCNMDKKARLRLHIYIYIIHLTPKDLCSMMKISNNSIPNHPKFHTMPRFVRNRVCIITHLLLQSIQVYSLFLAPTVDMPYSASVEVQEKPILPCGALGRVKCSQKFSLGAFHCRTIGGRWELRWLLDFLVVHSCKRSLSKRTQGFKIDIHCSKDQLNQKLSGNPLEKLWSDKKH